MRKPTEDRVQNFLEDASLFDGEKFAILMGLRRKVFRTHPKTKERMRYGGIMFSNDAGDFGGIFIRKNHVSLEFANGASMRDPKKLLEGTGASRRHLKFRSLPDVKSKDAEFFIRQIPG